MPAAILVPGRNCQTIARADRLAVIIDGAPYFTAVASALEEARRSVLLVGWDFDPRIRLRRRPGEPDESLGEFLSRLVRARPGLTIRVLNWTYGMAFGAARRQIPTPLLAPALPQGIDLRLDTTHPIGGAQHQKLVVVDDSLAFCGGLDLTAGRWDTPEHRDDDPRRVDPGLGAYAPYHDYAVAVDGPAARAVRAVAAERWRVATGETLEPVPPRPLWPAGLEPLLRDVAVGVARTLPGHAGRPPVHEVATLVADAISRAQRTIYIESQYLSGQDACDLMVRRLKEPGGPEIVLISLPRANSHMEEITLGTARDHLEAILRRADRYGRLRIYYPVTAGGGRIIAHGKLLVADDVLLRIGSANLANRSMGLDSECDVALDATTQGAQARQAVLAVRDAAIAEHLGVAPAILRREIAARRSLIGAIEALRRPQGRSLRPLPRTPPPLIGRLATRHRLFDPARPRGPVEVGAALGRVLWGLAKRRPAATLIGLAALAGLAAGAVSWRRPGRPAERR